MDYVKLIVLGIVALLAAVAANWAHDLAYQVHAILIMLIAGGLFFFPTGLPGFRLPMAPSTPPRRVPDAA